MKKTKLGEWREREEGKRGEGLMIHGKFDVDVGEGK